MGKQYSPRVLATLKKYASIIGGKSADGEQFPQDEARCKQHLFVVRNKDQENPAWSFVLGHVIEGLVIDDCYDIDYIGLNKDYLPPDREPKTPEQKAVRKKVQKYWKRQTEDIRDQDRARDEKNGIFHYEDEDAPETEESEELVKG